MQTPLAILRLLRSQVRLVGLFALVGLLAGAVAVFSQPLRYGATVRVLIIQKASIALDPYTAIKSAERIADNLSQIVYTQDFFSKTIAEDPTIDQTQFPTDPKKRAKQWHAMLWTGLGSGTGLLSVTALSPEKDEAAKIAQAIAGVLTVHGREYIGGDVEVKLVDTPLVSSFPVSPNIPAGLLLGLVLGSLVGSAYVVWRDQHPKPPAAIS